MTQKIAFLEHKPMEPEHHARRPTTWRRNSIMDRLYSGSTSRGVRFFEEGWGPEEQIAAFQELPSRVGKPAPLDLLWTWRRKHRGVLLQRGVFVSPMASPILPPESHRAHVLLVLPSGQPPVLTPGATPNSLGPIALHLAATGDEGFSRRLHAFALPLARHGIASIILENPYYGARKPRRQTNVYLNAFTDLLIMGETTVREGWALLEWLGDRGFGPLAVTGVSMGGHMSLIIGAVTRRPVAITPCIGMHSAAPVFADGIMSEQLAWDVLGADLGGEQAARQRVRDILAASDVRRYPMPTRPDATVCISALRDAYVHNGSIEQVRDHWPGTEIRWVRAGHVRAYVSYGAVFRQAILDSLERLSS
ncbi:MAG: alpha/beta hydrolase family protein [Myxococcota bacterium]